MGSCTVDARLYLLQLLDGQYGLAISQRALESSVLLIGYQQCLIELLHALAHKVGRRYGMTGMIWYGMAIALSTGMSLTCSRVLTSRPQSTSRCPPAETCILCRHIYIVREGGSAVTVGSSSCTATHQTVSHSQLLQGFLLRRMLGHDEAVLERSRQK
jgi:hypothetical protein